MKANKCYFTGKWQKTLIQQGKWTQYSAEIDSGKFQNV